VNDASDSKKTQKVTVPPLSARGEAARAARSKLARSLLTFLGAPPDIAATGSDEAADDSQFLDDIVASLVDDGVVSLARLPERRATEADLDPSLLGRPFLAALDRRRGLPAGARERTRLARLYGLAGDPEKAASCYREVLDEKGYLPLPLVIELAQIAARAGDRALALGAVDRVAEVVLTGDAGKDGRAEDVAVAGGALERARDVALELDAAARAADVDDGHGAAARAVALARAAVLLYERSGLKREAARALDGLGRAQLATGERAAGRATFERRRGLAAAQGDLGAAARSLEVAADAFLATGDAEAAVDRLEQAGDVHASAGDRTHAARAALRAAELRIARGDLAAAASTLERARAHAAASGSSELEASARILAARAACGEGQLGNALREAEAAVFDREQAKDAAAAAEARVVQARALLLAGAPDEAHAQLARARDDASGVGAARALEVRAEIAFSAGRTDEAHALLADAGRFHALEERPVDAQRARVRRSELAIEKDDREAAAALHAPVAAVEAPELVARIALVEAALATDDGVRRSALDRAFDLAFATDYMLPRVASGIARSRARLLLGRPSSAAADARAALEAVRDAWKSLPEERRSAFLASSLARRAYDAGRAARDAVLAQRSERKSSGASNEETAGVETVLNALDLLLGQLGGASA
jgi:hypothetical protein